MQTGDVGCLPRGQRETGPAATHPQAEGQQLAAGPENNQLSACFTSSPPTPESQRARTLLKTENPAQAFLVEGQVWGECHPPSPVVPLLLVAIQEN